MTGEVHTDAPALGVAKIGLVLGGGGAKGAYQVGVWQALAQYGVTQFQCISGTSVGGLNALLVASSTPEEGRRIWMSLADFKKRSNRFATAIALWTLLGALSISPSLLAMLLYPAYHAVLHGEETLWTTLWLVFVLAGAVASTSVMSAILTKMFGLFGDLLGIVGVLSLLLAFTVWSALVMLPFANPSVLGITTTSAKVVNVVLAIVGGALSTGFWFGYLNICNRLHRKCASIGLLDRQALEAIISDKLQGKLWKPEEGNIRSLHVTVAKEARHFDPDREVVHGSVFTGSSMQQGTTKGTWHTVWFPCYVDVLGLPRNARHTVFLDSAALPFAFKNLITQTASYTDGGVVDNLPLAPILSGEKLDLVIIVSLNPYRLPNRYKLGHLVDELWAKHLKGTHLTHESDTYDHMEARYKQMFNLTNPSRYIDKTPIVVICPKSRLATIDVPFLRFFTGTLNFEAAVLRLWMRNGYKDACKALGHSPEFLRIVQPAGH
jgi:predicted acylesterase/phospholipase RssA